MHLQRFVVLVGHLAHRAGVRTVLLVVKHVLPQRRLALETRVADVAERMRAQMRLQHVEADHADDAAQAAAVDRLLAGRDQMRDEVAVSFELLATFKAGIHAEAVGASKVLHHLLDGQLVDVAQVARIRLVQRFDAEFVQHLATGTNVDVLVRFFVGHIFHVDIPDFGEELVLRVFAETTQQMIVVRSFQVFANVLQVGFLDLVTKADWTVEQLDFAQRFLDAQQQFV